MKLFNLGSKVRDTRWSSTEHSNELDGTSFFTFLLFAEIIDTVERDEDTSTAFTSTPCQARQSAVEGSHRTTSDEEYEHLSKHGMNCCCLFCVLNKLFL